jgi:hypothetical protein
MAMPELAVDTVSIVIRGAFIPSDLWPQQLADQGLVTAQDLSDATQRFSNNDISILETQRIRFLANHERIQLTAQQADEFEPLRDLAVGILRLFTTAAVGAMGINRDVHFAAASIDEWHAVGDTLVPKEIWSGTLDFVGLSSVTLTGARESEYQGYRQVTIQSSNIVTNGVFVSHNDHYTLDPEDKMPTSRDQISKFIRRTLMPNPEKNTTAITILNNEWQSSMTRSDAVIELVARGAKS